MNLMDLEEKNDQDYLEVTEKYSKRKEIIGKLKHHNELLQDFDYGISYRGSVVLQVESIRQLREIRKIARSIFGNWRDKIDMIWTVGDNDNGSEACVSYSSNDVFVEIWLSLPIDKMEKYLCTSKKFESCCFGRVREERLDFVCRGTK